MYTNYITMKKYTLLLAFILIAISAQSQNIKPFLKAGTEFFENGKYAEAIEQFTKAIELQPATPATYVKRAKAYEKNNETLKAAEDYDNAVTFDVKDEESYANAARLYYNLKDYEKAIDRSTTSLKLDNNYDVLALKVDAELKNKSYGAALIDAKILLAHKSSDVNYFRVGVASENSGLTADALKAYQNAIDRNDKNVEAYTALANVQYQAKNSITAQKNADQAIKLNPKFADAYRVRAKIFSDQLKVAEVINDISTVILLEPEVDENYFTRGIYYQLFAQHPNAINDFTKVINLNPHRIDAYYKRAYSYEQIMNFKEAIKDYATLRTLGGNDKGVADLLEKSKERLYELNRETDKPYVTISKPIEKPNHILQVPNNSNAITVSGRIEDASGIKSLIINTLPVAFEKTDAGYKFTSEVALTKDTVTLHAVDVYDNAQDITYSLIRTEVDTPEVKIMAPYASDDKTIFLDSQDPKVFIEGKVFDESTISSIYIDGVVASFTPQELNPTFQAYINVTNKDRFTVTVEDKFGNTTHNTYTLNRDGITIAEGNPMGKTWVVFVENSNYQNFANLEGPTKDVSLMKSALVKYNVNNLIHKKDMTKLEMERFFSIELRDLVKSNHVTSLLIWYAGHGKFLNETGYWVAVDAKRDDEFTYFNVNSLKASLNNYNISVAHTLVITDACESGPSFYQAMRSEPKARSCGDLSAKMKSSQVFSSAGYELAVDNSQFTKTFANTLINSQDACLPIESIVQRVTTAVTSNNQQKPLFGKIAGLGDEDGTFFFIAK